MANVWDGVTNYSELLETNKMFVAGQLFRTPYHFGPLMDDSIPLIPGLLEMHDLGMLTVGGQSSDCEYGVYSNYTYTTSKPGNWYKDTKQKAYVQFYMLDNEKNRKFVNNLLSSPILAITANFLKSDTQISNYPEKHCFNVTCERVNEVKAELPNSPWHYYTNLWNNNDACSAIAEWGNYFNIKEILSTTIRVSVAFREYGGKLEPVIIDMYKSL